MATPKQAFVAGPQDVLVKIGLNSAGNITVTPDPFYIRKGIDEKVVWLCTENHEHGTEASPCFTVDFNKNEKILNVNKNLPGSPFRDWHFCGHGASSGPAIVAPNEEKLYKYTVSMHGKSVDPEGGVKP